MVGWAYFYKVILKRAKKRAKGSISFVLSLLLIFQTLFPLLLMQNPASAAESITPLNSKTGISIEFLKPDGTSPAVEGEDYLVEPLYYDPLYDGHFVVYIKDSTKISLFHNENNIDANGNPNGDNGIITCMLDGDELYRYLYDAGYFNGDNKYGFAKQEGVVWEYQQPFSLAEKSKGVGDNGETYPHNHPNWNRYTPPNYWYHYHYGQLDDFGDEWHTLTYWDNDGSSVSDGKIVYFVLNPKTPAIKFTATGNDQYYTTPPKGYNQPIIRQQTTYLTSGVRISLFNLTDPTKDIYYRVGNSGSWNIYTSPLLASDLFSADDTVYEFQYKIGQDGPVRVRRIHYNPSPPSKSEKHPILLWTPDEENVIKSRITREPYKSLYQALKNQVDLNRNYHDGKRYGSKERGWATDAAYAAFVWRMEGLESYAEQAKANLLSRTYDLLGPPTGATIVTSEFYTEWHSLDNHVNWVIAYDLLVGYPGMTPIEEIKIRDNIANMVRARLQDSWHMNNHNWAVNSYNMVAAAAVAMPTYDNPVFGHAQGPERSGENATIGCLDPTPSWFNAVYDKDTNLNAPGFPGYSPMGLWGQVKESGTYNQTLHYWGYSFGKMLPQYAIFKKHYDGKSLLSEPRFRNALIRHLLTRRPSDNHISPYDYVQGRKPSIEFSPWAYVNEAFDVEYAPGGKINELAKWQLEFTGNSVGPDYPYIHHFKIAFYDDTIQAKPPVVNSKIFKSGFVFSSNFDDSNSVFFFQHAEEEPTYPDYYRRPDKITFHLDAYGERLIAGLDDYASSGFYTLPGHFNNILVDDPGDLSSGVSRVTGALTLNYFLTNYLDYAVLQTQLNSRYDDGPFKDKVQLTRNVFFPDKKYIFFVDQVDSIDGNSHTYDWIIHGLQGSGGNFSRDGNNSATWTKASGVELKAFFVSPDVSLSDASLVSGTRYVKARVNNVADQKFIVLLIPLNAGQSEPVVTKLNAANYAAAKMVDGSNAYYVMTKSSSAIETVDDVFTTDAELALLKKAGENLDYFQINKGKTFNFGSVQYISSSNPVNLTLRKERTGYVFQIESADSSTSTVLTLGGLVPNAEYQLIDNKIVTDSSLSETKQRVKTLTFTADSQGKYTYVQDLSKHEVRIQQVVNVTPNIKLDNFGYRPGDKKIAIFTANPGGEVVVKDLNGETVYTVPSSKITYKGTDNVYSGDEVWEVDFSGFSQEGVFYLESPAVGRSYDFEISESVYNGPLRAAVKSFYYQRCGIDKPQQYAGNWSDDKACHTEDTSVTKASSASEDFGTLDLSGGWHDAGDYNKYLWGDAPWDAAAPWGLMTAYELNPRAFGDDTGIPESGNGIPDILDEVKWELDWYLKMQREDGRVLDMVHAAPGDYTVGSPPSADKTKRYYFDPKPGSAAHFVAAVAQGARVFEAFDPEYAQTLKQAAIKSWNYLLSESNYNTQSKLWAAAEVFRMDNTIESAKNYIDSHYSSYGLDVYNPYLFTIWAYCNTPGATPQVVENMRNSLSSFVNSIFANNDLYLSGMDEVDYGWGSNRQKARYGIVLVLAAKLGATGSHTPEECLEHAQDFLHYLQGLNSLNMVYLSNMSSYGGEHSVMQMFHAWFGYGTGWGNNDLYCGKPQSVEDPLYPYYSADNRTSTYGPAPGYLVGGPNKNYSGSETPPAGQIYPHRFYRDWTYHTGSQNPFEVNEPSNAYTSAYIALAAPFVANVPDTVSPNTSINEPVGGVLTGSSKLITGTANDDYSISSVQVQIQRISDNYYWNGSSWQSSEVWNQATITNGTGTSSVEWSYNWALPQSDGEVFIVKARAMDSSGNVDSTPAEITVTVDNVAPAGSIVINGGAAYTTSTTVTVSNSITGAVEMRFSVDDGSTWTSWESYAGSRTLTLPSGDGTKIVHAQFRDGAQNVYETSNEIILDTELPVIVDYYPVGGSSDVPLNVNVTVNFSEELDEASVNNSNFLLKDSSGNVVTSTVSYNSSNYQIALDPQNSLQPSETYIVELRGIRDMAGNEMEPFSWSFSTSTSSDTIPPETTITLSNTVLKGTVTPIYGTSTDNVGISRVELCIKRDKDGTYWDGNQWVNKETWLDAIISSGVNTSHAIWVYNWELPRVDGETFSLRARGVDIAGNVEHTAILTVLVDNVPPSGSIEVQNGALYTNSTQVTVNNAVSGATEMRFSVDGITWSSWEDFSSSKSLNLPDENGTKIVKGEFRDVAGNLLSVEDSIILDTQAPQISVSGVKEGGVYYSSVTPIINIADNYEVEESSVTLDGNPYTSGTPISNLGTHTLSIWAKDIAGNESNLNLTFKVALGKGGIDFNGDRKSDIGIFYKYASNRTGLWTFTSNGNTFSYKRVWLNYAWSWDKSKITSGDFNGDGLSDIAILYKYASNRTGLWTFTSNGSTFSYKRVWLNYAWSWDKSKVPGEDIEKIKPTYLGWTPGRDIPVSPGQIGKVVIKGARASNNQKIYLYDWSGNLMAFAPCSTGKNYGTPLGRYTVAYKKLIMISYSGTLYARYPTYFRKNFAIHGWPRYISSGRFYHYELLGKPASAGCVRVPEEVAKAIWTGSVVSKTKVEILP